MKLADFILQPRGPRSFDHYVHRRKIPSVLGDFSLEFQVDDASLRPPDEKMLAAMVALCRAFESDIDALSSLVHEQYRQASEDEAWRKACDLPEGLCADELATLLDARAISVSQDETDEAEPNPGRIYMSPR